ncbi:MAG: hypothetical protein K2P81_03385 [Bacteriovoracaceae bacterium]|nr:hypothetical protein [Bacteriovoracaceae bacterium]
MRQIIMILILLFSTLLKAEIPSEADRQHSLNFLVTINILQDMRDNYYPKKKSGPYDLSEELAACEEIDYKKYSQMIEKKETYHSYFDLANESKEDIARVVKGFPLVEGSALVPKFVGYCPQQNNPSAKGCIDIWMSKCEGLIKNYTDPIMNHISKKDALSGGPKKLCQEVMKLRSESHKTADEFIKKCNL